MTTQLQLINIIIIKLASKWGVLKLTVHLYVMMCLTAYLLQNAQNCVLLNVYGRKLSVCLGTSISLIYNPFIFFWKTSFVETHFPTRFSYLVSVNFCYRRR